ncbi:cell division initiation protein [Desulfocicer vacuolatum DSM 3385]|uniref:Cell division initiation protein n=1 Tax=Desulfocicer vacuolatum DSM 3385 TaxID=1121400 RepID=A0A1W2DYH7_9BACT|nr:DivIVA domain-containing protein [Desulfocicer vacuolatum]SMD02554.1 cell division initiation protein [Desulfocicer vacuolatum DSM 3385]
MGITPAVIQQKEFSTRFRGFDIREVDTFLEEVAQELTRLNDKIKIMDAERHRLDLENRGYRERENTMKHIMVKSQQVIDEMKKNASKSAESIIADAETQAEKILNRAHQRLAQLYSDITELKRQRMQIEVQIGAVIENHSKLLKMSIEENKAADEADPSLKFMKQG